MNINSTEVFTKLSELSSGVPLLVAVGHQNAGEIRIVVTNDQASMLVCTFILYGFMRFFQYLIATKEEIVR